MRFASNFKSISFFSNANDFYDFSAFSFYDFVFGTSVRDCYRENILNCLRKSLTRGGKFDLFQNSTLQFFDLN